MVPVRSSPACFIVRSMDVAPCGESTVTTQSPVTSCAVAAIGAETTSAIARLQSFIRIMTLPLLNGTLRIACGIANPATRKALSAPAQGVGGPPPGLAEGGEWGVGR